MSALPRPELSSGPARELNDALHELHHRAGWPSLRALARDAGVSHTTVSKVFSTAALPSWGTVELLVEAMNGETSAFHHMWLAASTPASSNGAPASRIAGRKAELDVVRRHLETGTGLLLVTGEAGIGKTKLVTTAAEQAEAFVATGHCLPLSSEVSLLPMADILHEVYASDDGQWVEEAVAACPGYVRALIGRLLPQVAAEDSDDDSDPEARHLLFSAIWATFTSLRSQRPFAVLVEDLHWTDATTRDLLEHGLTRASVVPVIGTWRSEDRTTAAASSEWLSRLRRLSTVTEIELRPLSLDDTAEQLAQLAGVEPTPDVCDRIHSRSLGHPLFTEQLAAHASGDEGLPAMLEDLLDQRLSGISEAAWLVASALGVADRALADSVVSAVTELPSAALSRALHELRDKRLLGTADGARGTQLRHPLLAEAVRRRLLPGEAIDQHRRLAEALASTTDPSAAEIAQHWQGAGDGASELLWRLHAARGAAERFAWAQEADHLLRALEIWPMELAGERETSRSRAEVTLDAMDALKVSGQFDRAAAISDAVEGLSDLEPILRAEFLRRAADYRSDREGPAVGLPMLADAIELFRTLPPSIGLVHALHHKSMFLLQAGQFTEAFTAAREASEAAAEAEDQRTHRHVMSRLAWYEGIAGSLDDAITTMSRSRDLVAPGSDPRGDVWEAMLWTDVLLQCGARSEDVESAGRSGLGVAEAWEIASHDDALTLRANVALAMLRDGRVPDAAALIDTETEEPVDLDRGVLHLARGMIDARRGRLAAAAARLDFLWSGYGPRVLLDLDFVPEIATVDLWNGQPARALERLLYALDANVDTTPPSVLLPILALTARAAADTVPLREGEDLTHVRDRLFDLYRRSRLGERPPQHHAAGQAFTAMWASEVARFDGRDTVDLWGRAGGQWDMIGRPHDASYCRWRAAQVALREDQGTVAARLLKRAANDAREHIPLSEAIAATGAAA